MGHIPIFEINRLFQVKAPAYYMGTAAPSTLPRGGGGGLVRAYSPAAQPPVGDRGKPHSVDC